MAVNPIQSSDGFVTAFDRYAALIHRYAARRVGGVLADDICSETFVTAFEKRGDFTGTEQGVLPWLYGIAARRMLKHHRAETRRWKAYARTGVEVCLPHWASAWPPRADPQPGSIGQTAFWSAHLRPWVAGPRPRSGRR